MLLRKKIDLNRTVVSNQDFFLLFRKYKYIINIYLLSVFRVLKCTWWYPLSWKLTSWNHSKIVAQNVKKLFIATPEKNITLFFKLPAFFFFFNIFFKNSIKLSASENFMKVEWFLYKYSHLQLFTLLCLCMR